MMTSYFIFILALFFCYFLFIVNDSIAYNVNCKSTTSTKKGKNVNSILIYSIILFIITIFFCSQIDPPSGWDLYRHYEEIDKIRLYGLEYAFEEGIYKQYYVISLLFYLVSLQSNNNLLVIISLSIEFLIYFSVLKYFINKGTIKKSNTILLCNIYFFATINLVQAVSGIRNILAFMIALYGVFITMYKNKKILPIICYLLAVFIHPFSLMIVLIYFISKLKFKKCIFVILILWGFFYNEIISLLLSIDTPYFEELTENFKMYQTMKVDSDYRIIFLQVFLTVFGVYLIYKNKTIKKNHLQLGTFVLLYTAFALGSLSNMIFFQRASYALSLILIPFVIENYEKEKGLWVYIFVGCSLLLTLFQVLRIYNIIRGAA